MIKSNWGKIFTLAFVLLFAFSLITQFKDVASARTSGKSGSLDNLEDPENTEALTQECQCPTTVSGLTNNWNDCTNKVEKATCDFSTCGYYSFNIETGEWGPVIYACKWNTKCQDPCPRGQNWIILNACPTWAGSCSGYICSVKNRQTGAVEWDNCEDAP